MPYDDYQQLPWYKLTDKSDKEEYIKRIIERCNTLHKSLKEFRIDASRYFERIEFKKYKVEGQDQKHLTSDYDDGDENVHIENPYLTLNVSASCVETVTSKVAKTKPKVTFLTKGASKERIEVATKIDKWILKIFKQGSLWKLSSQGFKSACVTGLGIIKVVIKENKVKFHKIPVFDFFTENGLIGNTETTEAGEMKNLSYHEILELFPEKEEELTENYNKNQTIKVYEIYKEHYKQVITTDKVLLSEKSWPYPVPYKFLRFETSDQGVVSVGICKKLNALHNSITYILSKTFTSIKNFAVPRIFLRSGSNPTVKDIANVVGQIIEVQSEEGSIPQFSTPKPMDNQVLEILIMLWQKSFEIIGVSELSAGGKIPRGLEKASGAALRSYQQVESERFQIIRSDYESFFIDITKLIIKLVDDSMLPNGVSRKDIMELKEDATIWTSSLLPETPSGKLAMVTDMFNTGLIQGSMAIDLLQSPDLASYAKSETSRMRAVDITIDRALDKGQVPVFFPALGLELSLDRARKKFAMLLIDEPDEKKKLDNLASFVNDLTEKSKEQTKIREALEANTGGAGAGAGGAPGGTPGGAPGGQGQMTGEIYG